MVQARAYPVPGHTSTGGTAPPRAPLTPLRQRLHQPWLSHRTGDSPARSWSPATGLGFLKISQRFGAQAIPTLLVLRGGKVTARQTGAAPLAALRTWADNALAQAAR
jgi:hypothetical protein